MGERSSVDFKHCRTLEKMGVVVFGGTNSTLQFDDLEGRRLIVADLSVNLDGGNNVVVLRRSD